jgi:hypothetical protein
MKRVVKPVGNIIYTKVPFSITEKNASKTGQFGPQRPGLLHVISV